MDMTKILRMFRTCGKNRTLPTGTLALLEEESGLTFRWHADGGAFRSGSMSGFEVYDQPPMTEKDPLPTGRVEMAFADGTAETFHFHRELPVTGEVIAQTVSQVHVNPKVKATTEE